MRIHNAHITNLKPTTMNTNPTHTQVVSFYKDNTLQKKVTLGLITDAPLCWERILLENGEYPCLEIGEYKLITRCVREFDYSITSLVPISEAELISNF